MSKNARINVDVSHAHEPVCEDIVLVGPMGAGKSTVAALLAAELARPVCNVDALREKYYPMQGLTLADVKSIEREHGFRALYERMKPFEIHMVEQVLVDYAGSVFDFGAGNSVYTDPDHVGRIQRLLDHLPNVFLLLPCADLTDAMLSLNRTSGDHLDLERLELNRHFLTSPSNSLLAKHTLYTHNSSPNETCVKILSRLTTGTLHNAS